MQFDHYKDESRYYGVAVLLDSCVILTQHYSEWTVSLSSC